MTGMAQHLLSATTESPKEENNGVTFRSQMNFSSVGKQGNLSKMLHKSAAYELMEQQNT